MATINLGNIKFNWKGTYAGGTAYVIDDVVSYSGSSYICKLASTGNLPTNTTYWDVMSQAGTDGTDLTSTLTTQGDLLYRDGSGLQRLAAGTSGQALVTQGTGANPIWSTVGGTNTPTWFAYLNSTVDVTRNAFVTVPFGHELFDTDNAFDTSNYRFTVPSGKAGKYFVQFSVNIGGVGDNQTERRYTKLMKNGSNFVYGLNQDLTSDADAINHDTSDSSAIVDLAVGDYLTVEAYHQNTASTGRFMGGSNYVTRFTGFKLL
jgi:hypothetical protein